MVLNPFLWGLRVLAICHAISLAVIESMLASAEPQAPPLPRKPRKSWERII